jgi:hypothetical protein
MPRDPFVREKSLGSDRPPKSWPRNISSASPKDRYQTAVESWRNLQSQNIEFTMKRLREPVEIIG